MPAADALPRPITFLSDYGHRDEFVGVCHAVIARRCPTARVIDLTHGIPAQDVRAGALALRSALPYTPAGVHLAVVDPGVGAVGAVGAVSAVSPVGASSAGARRCVALRVGDEDRLLVGPDNGLLTPAADALGGVVEAVDVGDSPERLEPISRTFHGRDVFAPVAAALACGAELGAVGAPLPAGELSGLELPTARVLDGALGAHVLFCDGFGNVILDASAEQLAGAGAVPGAIVTIERAAGGAHRTLYGETFADVPAGELVLYEDAQGMVALALNGGSAAELLGVARDDELTVRAR